MFPSLGVNVLIILIPLVGFGSWIFGRRFGLLIIIPILVYCYFLLGPIYGDRLDYYQAKGGGIIIMTVAAILIGTIRHSYDMLKTAHRDLDHRVAQRNAELSNLTAKLLDEAESTRVIHGQMLHDGIGQQLTGIQLYCTSVAGQLVVEGNPSASLAFSMRASAQAAHDIIRKTARMLFPVRMRETGLIPALSELVACLDEMKHVSIGIDVDGDFRDRHDDLALSLYRICHESAMCAITALHAKTIKLGIKEDDGGYELTVQHDGTSWAQLNDNLEQRLILYRLQSLGGACSSNQSGSGCENIIYRIPKI
jgi:signal transduction histidine kinase